MSAAMQHLRQTLGANLAPEQTDVQAREQVGAKLGSGRDQVTPEATPEATPEVTPEVRRMLTAITGKMSRGEIMARLGLKDESSFESTCRSEEP